MEKDEAFKTAYKSIEIGDGIVDRHVPLSEARANFPSLVTEAAEHGKRSIVTRFNKPAAAIIPIYDLVRLLKIDEKARDELMISEVEPGDEIETVVPHLENDRPITRNKLGVEENAIETLEKIVTMIEESKVLDSGNSRVTPDDDTNAEKRQYQNKAQPSSKSERDVCTQVGP
ncbi:type II toxin-antitoxin system Phd/YefM family antitoxin [Roseibium sp.]|uniref:type II toxin-antitoxin system Phd/YefM family antitoxin n=1 Tax=Roseibium sp. TaxID=1936156 RepID=UPI003BAB0B05